MTDGFAKILDIKKRYREDGYEVPAIRVDEETFDDILSDPSFIRETDKDFEIDVENEEAIGIAGAMEIIPDDSISEPVPDDVRGLWRNE